MKTMQTYLRRNWLWLLVQVGAAFPLLWLAWDRVMGNLSFDPIDDFTNRTGTAAIVLLLFSLAVTPVNIVTGWRKVLSLRKSLGLWAFAYAVLHLLVFVGLDYAFNLRFILLDGLPSKPYVLVGFSALLILLALALTSTQGAMKRLGKNWKRLHRLVYVAGILAVVHYLWVAKVAFGTPTLFTAILAVLLAVRVPAVRSRIIAMRKQVAGQLAGRGAKSGSGKATAKA